MDIEFVSESYARVNKTPKRKSSSKRKGSSGRGGHSEAHKAAISEGLRRYYAGKGKKKTAKSSTKPKTKVTVKKKEPKTHRAKENQKYKVPRGLEATEKAYDEEKVKYAELEKKTKPIFDKLYELGDKHRAARRKHLTKDGKYVNQAKANKDPKVKAAEKTLKDFEKKHKKLLDEYHSSGKRVNKLKTAIIDKEQAQQAKKRKEWEDSEKRRWGWVS